MVWHYQKSGVQGVPARTFDSLEEVRQQMPHFFRDGGPYSFGDGGGNRAVVLYRGSDTGWRLIAEGL